MRLKKDMIKFISNKLVHRLLDEEMIIFTEEPSRLEEIIAQIITSDLMVEDKLNDEVKKILDSHTSGIGSRDINYGVMFQMIKKKLVRERKLIL